MVITGQGKTINSVNIWRERNLRKGTGDKWPSSKIKRWTLELGEEMGSEKNFVLNES